MVELDYSYGSKVERERMGDSHIQRLATLIRERNQLDDQIAALIGRPAQPGHIGEYIASAIFDIQLEVSAVQAGFDGRFGSGPLVGRTVNIKWYAKREGLLDINRDHIPDHYLVLAGPKTSVMSSKGGTRPLLIEEVFLFDGKALVDEQEARGVKLGVASSVPNRYWDEARIYPRHEQALIKPTDKQEELLGAFA